MTKQSIYDEVKNLESLCQETSRFLWNHPETGGNERVSSDYMRSILKEEGFVIVDEEKLPYAFYAEYGSGKPVIAILGEYDALPGLSQKICAVKDPMKEGTAGHGCSHNLLGAASITGAIAVKRFLEKEGIPGTVRFYGCPEEELLSGKVKMAYYRMFDGCDVALSWHPMSFNMVYDEGYLANASMHFYFKGKTAHAAFAPEQGRSALDAVELTSIGSNYLREHVIDKARIHYTTDSGGFSPNIVPDHASTWYFVRAPHMEDVKDIIRRLEKVAQGAALMTETEVETKIDCGCYEMRCNHAFADLTYANMQEAELPVYTEKEMQFASELQSTLDPVLLKNQQMVCVNEKMIIHDDVGARDMVQKIPLTSSSDSGDVSQIMPMNLFSTACWPVGCSPHTWQATASGGSSIGEKGALYASRVIAGVAYDLLTDEAAVAKIQNEFQEQSAECYQPMYQEI